jgi:hypothetical protein
VTTVNCMHIFFAVLYLYFPAVNIIGNDGETAKAADVEDKMEPGVIKTEPLEADEVSLATSGAVKSDNLPVKTESTTPSKKFELLSPVAEFHASIVKRMKERADLVSNIGPYRRALCARRDLAVRRALCKVDKVNDESALRCCCFVGVFGWR